MIYVVMNYDHVAYAGKNLKDAVKKVKGSGTVQIWSKGVKIGYYRYGLSSKRTGKLVKFLF